MLCLCRKSSECQSPGKLSAGLTKWRQDSPDTGTLIQGYDAAGQRTVATLNDGTSIHYGYDALGRLTSRSAGTQTQTFGYDTCTGGKGQLCSVADANGSECFSYDPQGHLAARRIVTYGRDYTTGYGYDAVGALSSMSYPSGTAVQYTRTGGEITQVKAMVNGATINVVAGAALDADGRLTNWSYGNGMVCAGQRHGNVRLRRAGAVDQRVHPAAGSAVGYGYDANGNLNRPGFLGGRLV